MTLSLRYTARCEIGLVRKNNQDSCYVSPTMLIVADGMGGAAAGDLASAVVIRELRSADTERAEDMPALLMDAVGRATAAIAELVETDTGLDGMGSTVTGIMFDEGRAVVLNIGDSRTYLYRGGVLTRLTHDHSWVQSLVDEGRISEEESLIHPHRSLILRVINGQAQHTPDLATIDLLAGDRVLVCSDGLCGFVTDDVIGQHMDGELNSVLETLTALAHGQGGLDNITIILADVVDAPPEGQPLVYGAAALLDLDTPLDTVTMDLSPDDTVFAAQPPPRPDPELVEQIRYAPTAKRSAGVWVKVLITVLLPLIVIAAGGFAWYQYTQQQSYVEAVGEKVVLYRGVAGDLFGIPLSSVVDDTGPTITDLPTKYQEAVRAGQSFSSLEAGHQYLQTLGEWATKCAAYRAGSAVVVEVPPETPPETPPFSPSGPLSPSVPSVPSSPSDPSVPNLPSAPTAVTVAVPPETGSATPAPTTPAFDPAECA